MVTIAANASLAGAAVVMVIWLLSRMRSLSPATRAWLWLVASARFLVALIWIAPIVLPVLPAPDPIAAAQVSTIAMPPATPTPTIAPSADPAAAPWPSVPTVLLVVWAAGLVVSTGVAVRRWLRIRAIVRRSTPPPQSILDIAADIGRRLGLRPHIDVRCCEEIATPLVIGPRRPVILVPAARFDALSEAEQRMVLCHEMMHVRRGDLWLASVPAVAERLFFFHPLAHLAAREYAFWREAACDAAVLDALDAAPQDYGRLLLNLGVARPAAPLAPAGASWSFGNLKRRIVMLGERPIRSRGSRLLAAGAVGLALASFIPVQLAARRPAGADIVLPAGPKAPAYVRLAAAAIEPGAPQSSARQFTYVIFLKDDGNEHSMMSGSGTDMDRAYRFRRPGESLLWFRDGEREYVVRDRIVIDQIRALWKPVGELGAEQGKLGAKQGALGAQQGQIGAEQGQLGAEQGRLGAQQGRLAAQQATLMQEEQRTLSRERREWLRQELRKIDEESRVLGERMRALGEKMRELNEPMEALGSEMRELGREMEKLGEQMRVESAKAEKAVNELLQRLVSTSKVEPVK